MSEVAVKVSAVVSVAVMVSVTVPCGTVVPSFRVVPLKVKAEVRTVVPLVTCTSVSVLLLRVESASARMQAGEHWKMDAVQDEQKKEYANR